MAVSLGVAALLFLLAAQLLRSSQLVFLDAAREALDPEPRLAVAMLRRDVREALGVGAGVAGAGGSSLLLYMPGPSVIRYEQHGEALVRVRCDAAGTEVSRRTALAPILGWSWQEPAPGVVAVRLVTLDHPMTRSLLAGGNARLAVAVRPVTTVLLASRRLGRAGW